MLVAPRATSIQYLVAQTYFLVVPGVRTPDLSSPVRLYHEHKYFSLVANSSNLV